VFKELYPFLHIQKFFFVFKMPPIQSEKRSRSAISDDIKQQICVYATKPENKNITQQQIADYFNQ
jgi:hypothetical protein